MRLYLVIMVTDLPVAARHLHAETFEVFGSGSALRPDGHTDVAPLTLGERGAMGWILAEHYPEAHSQSILGNNCAAVREVATVTSAE